MVARTAFVLICNCATAFSTAVSISRFLLVVSSGMGASSCVRKSSFINGGHFLSSATGRK